MRNVLQIAAGLFVTTMMLGAGCVPGEAATPPAETTRAPTLAPTLPPSLMPTPVPTPVPTPTPSPDPALTPTAIPRPTVTPTPTFTPVPTPVATLTLTSPPQPTVEWVLPKDKYVFIERWITISSETSEGTTTGYRYIDFPMYAFFPKAGVLISRSGESRGTLAGEGLAGLKVAYGRGTQRTGSAGTGQSSAIVAVTRVPFVDLNTTDTDTQVTLLRVDASGVAYLRRGSEEFSLKPGEEWNRDVAAVVDLTFGQVGKAIVTGKERISNFGVLDKLLIRLDYPRVSARPSNTDSGIALVLTLTGFTPGYVIPADSISVGGKSADHEALDIPASGYGSITITVPTSTRLENLRVLDAIGMYGSVTFESGAQR